MGTILTRQLKDGTTRYAAMYDLPSDPITGKRRQRKQVCRTRTEAKKFLAQKQIERSNSAGLARCVSNPNKLPDSLRPFFTWRSVLWQYAHLVMPFSLPAFPL